MGTRAKFRFVSHSSNIKRMKCQVETPSFSIIFCDLLHISHDQGRFMSFCAEKEVPYPSWTRVLERHENVFHTSISEDLFSSCFMLLWKPLEFSSRKWAEEAFFGQSMRIGCVEVVVALVLFFSRASCKKIEALLQNYCLIPLRLSFCLLHFAVVHYNVFWKLSLYWGQHFSVLSADERMEAFLFIYSASDLFEKFQITGLELLTRTFCMQGLDACFVFKAVLNTQ